MKFAHLLWGSLERNRLRALFAFASVSVAFALFGVLETFRYASFPRAELDSLIVVNGSAGLLPHDYVDTIRAMAGVEGAAGTMLLPLRAATPGRTDLLAALDAKEYMQLFPAFDLSADARKAWLAARIGAVCDVETARRNGWKLHDRLSLPILGRIVRSGSNQLEVTLEGVFEHGSMFSGVLAHYDYVAEALGNGAFIGNIFVRVVDPAQATAIARNIDTRFRNSPAETDSMPFSVLAQQSVANARSYQLILAGTLAVSFFTMILITANALAQSVRERIGELAVMSVVGFQAPTLVLLTTAEALLLILAGGAAGLALSQAALSLHLVKSPSEGVALPVHTVGLAAAFILGCTLLTAALPAWQVMRMRIADALRRL